MVNGNHQLPDGWEWKSASEFCIAVECGSTPKADLMTSGAGEVPFIKVYNLTFDGALDFSIKPTFIDSKTHNSQLRRSKVLSGDILTNIVGPPLGKVSIAPNTYPEWNINQAIVLFRTGADVDNKYLSYLLQSPDFQQRLKATARATAGQFNVSLSTCRTIPMPIAPLNEQRQIVSKIEEVFTQLEAGASALERVQAGLRRYKASVLRAAVSGRLVNGNSVLGEGELSEGWRWTTMKDVCVKIQDGTHFSPKVQYDKREAGMYLYITAKNIKEHGVILDEITFIDEETHRENTTRCDPQRGDVLLIKDGVTTGVATVNQLDEEFTLLSSVALLRPNLELLDPYFLKHYLNSPVGFKNITGAMTGTAIKRIILAKIKTSPISLPPLEEQRRIVAEVERRLSVAWEVESAVEAALVRASRLRQAVLKSAFEGRLA